MTTTTSGASTAAGNAQGGQVATTSVAIEPVVSGMLSILTGAKSVVEKGGVFTLLTVGVVLTVAPTLVMFFDVGLSGADQTDYLIAMVTGAVVLAGGAIAGILVEADRRRRLVEVERLNFEMRLRGAALQGKILDHFAEMESAQQAAQIEHARATVDALNGSFMIPPGS